MFNFFYKYSHHFYLSSVLYNSILEKCNDIEPKTINKFLNKNGVLLNEKEIKSEKISKFLYLVTIKFKKRDKKSNLITFLKHYKELFPPWKTFPNMFQGAPRWNQGIAEDYCVFNWLPFWDNLDNKQKELYLLKYTCPLEWIEWLNEYEKRKNLYIKT